MCIYKNNLWIGKCNVFYINVYKKYCVMFFMIDKKE